MIIEINSMMEYIQEHGLDNNYCIVNNHRGYWITTTTVNDELWFEVYYNPDYKYIDVEYTFSSRLLTECLDFCDILYYTNTTN